MNKPTGNPFSAFNLAPVLMSAIEKAGYERPTHIQNKAIPAILEGGDILAGAETGSGKTAAYVLPMLQQLIQQKQQEGWMVSKRNHVRALVLVPTRELVVQVREAVNTLAQDIEPEVRCLSVYGGLKLEAQMKALNNGVDILISTPHRLLELSEQGALKFNKLQTLVVDEADRLVDDNFRDETEAIFKLLPNKRQNLLFTATFPESIRRLVRSQLDEPTIINLDHRTDVRIDQHAVTVNADRKAALLGHLLQENDWKQVLVFCNSKRTCDKLAEKLSENAIAAEVLHGDKAHKDRLGALDNFRSGTTRVLIATDIASRGIDIPQLDCVINYEPSRIANDYVHRVGRTGRAGKTGQVINLIAHHEYAHFETVEKRNGLRLKREQVKGFEASATAPPPPARSKPKKKGKLSKKKQLKRQQKKDGSSVRSTAERQETERGTPATAKASKREKTHRTESKPTSTKEKPDRTTPVEKKAWPVKTAPSDNKGKPEKTYSKEKTTWSEKAPSKDKTGEPKKGGLKDMEVKLTNKAAKEKQDVETEQKPVNEHIWKKKTFD